MDTMASLRRVWTIALASVLCVATVVTSHAGEVPACEARLTGGGAPGLQVQVDPETGTYSMPAPGTLTGPATSGARSAGDLVVRPGTSPAGGYQIRPGDEAASHQEQR